MIYVGVVYLVGGIKGLIGGVNVQVLHLGRVAPHRCHSYISILSSLVFSMFVTVEL